MNWPGSRADEMVATETEKRRRRWPFWVAGVVVLIAAGAGVFVWRQVRVLTSSKYQVVNYTVPSAPDLVAGPGETVYKIDPTQSSLTYSVEEKLFGQDAHTALGSTNGISGDIAINLANPEASRIGQIVVNVEQLHSDNNLRDARLRAANLESHKFPLAYLTASKFTDMPATITPGGPNHFKLESQLTVKKTPAPVTWNVEERLNNGKLSATATAKVKMSTFGIGPVSIAGLVSTADDVTLIMKLTALDPSKFTVPTAIAAPPDAPRSGDSPSFKTVVMPALQANCASCHAAGQVGSGHWTLTTAADAKKVSDGIGTVVDAKYMPPWPASDVGVPLNHSKQLDQKTLAAFVKWSRAGGPLDVDPDTKITPTKGPEGKPPRRDVVMKMPQAYTGSLSNPNDYRCFVLNPHITKPTFMTGYEVTPGNPDEIHHVQIFHIDASQVEASKAISGKDGKPGWGCYVGPSLRSRGPDRTAVRPNTPRTRRNVPQGQAGLIAGWVPGQDPVIYSENSGILMQPGDALVFQVHYHYNTTPKPDRSTVSVQLDPGTAPIKKLEIVNPIGPVEIPCMPGVVAPLCDRAAALKEAERLYGPAGSFIEPGLLGLCGKTAEELAATFKNGIADSSCDTKVPMSGTIVGTLGHMHTLGKTFRFTLDPDSPKPTVLLDIPVWNFDWQMNYELKKPIHVEAGQTVRMECSWDRAIEPNRAPKYIVFAEGTEDEMCFGTYAIIPDDQS